MIVIKLICQSSDNLADTSANSNKMGKEAEQNLSTDTRL
jgi:hypothetical protein